MSRALAADPDRAVLSYLSADFLASSYGTEALAHVATALAGQDEVFEAHARSAAVERDRIERAGAAEAKSVIAPVAWRMSRAVAASLTDELDIAARGGRLQQPRGADTAQQAADMQQVEDAYVSWGSEQDLEHDIARGALAGHIGCSVILGAGILAVLSLVAAVSPLGAGIVREAAIAIGVYVLGDAGALLLGTINRRLSWLSALGMPPFIGTVAAALYLVLRIFLM